MELRELTNFSWFVDDRRAAPRASFFAFSGSARLGWALCCAFPVFVRFGCAALWDMACAIMAAVALGLPRA